MRNVPEEWVSLDEEQILILLSVRSFEPIEGRIGLVADCVNAGYSTGPVVRRLFGELGKKPIIVWSEGERASACLIGRSKIQQSLLDPT